MKNKLNKGVKGGIHICFSSDMHPYNCDGGFGGYCPHCVREKSKYHNPADCALCDPEYDYMPNKYWKKKASTPKRKVNKKK